MQRQYSTDILSVSPRIADNGYTWAEAMLVCSQRRARLPNPRGDVARDIAIRLVPVIMKINGFTGPINFWSGSCNSAGTSCGAWSFNASNSGMFMKNLPVTTTSGFTYSLCQEGEFGLCSICSQVSCRCRGWEFIPFYILPFTKLTFCQEWESTHFPDILLSFIHIFLDIGQQ